MTQDEINAAVTLEQLTGEEWTVKCWSNHIDVVTMGAWPTGRCEDMILRTGETAAIALMKVTNQLDNE